MLASARDGAWITVERIRAYSILLLMAYALGTVAWFAMSKNGRDWQNQQFGADFSEVYAAGTLVDVGQAAAPYDMPRHFERQRELFGADAAIYTWNYPPFFLGAAGLLALLPYLAALLVWQAATFAGYLAAIGGILRPRLALLAAAAFPAVYSNFGHGQTGFLVAGLMGGGLMLLDRRPALAGVLLALVAIKPQFGPLIPIALAAGGRWRAFAAATITVIAAELERVLPLERGVLLNDAWAATLAGKMVLGAFLPLAPMSGSPFSTACRRRACTGSNTATPAITRCRACSPRRACWADPCRSPTPCMAR